MSNNLQAKKLCFLKNIALSKAQTGKKYRIKACAIEGEARVRLFEMGLTLGNIVCVTRKAPLGDPLEVEILGYRLCLRQSDACKFEVSEALDE